MLGARGDDRYEDESDEMDHVTQADSRRHGLSRKGGGAGVGGEFVLIVLLIDGQSRSKITCIVWISQVCV
jgi:hypothetical protein